MRAAAERLRRFRRSWEYHPAYRRLARNVLDVIRERVGDQYATFYTLSRP